MKETGTTGTQFFPIIIPQCHCPSHNLVGKGGDDHSTGQMALSGSVCHSANISNVEICLLFVPLLESVYFTPLDLEILNFKSTRQDLKLRNSVHMGRCVGGVCNFLGSVLLQQKFEATDGPVLQLCFTVQFYLVSKGKYILEA